MENLVASFLAAAASSDKASLVAIGECVANGQHDCLRILDSETDYVGISSDQELDWFRACRDFGRASGSTDKAGLLADFAEVC